MAGWYQFALHGVSRVNDLLGPDAAFDWNSQRITNLANPTGPTDAVTLTYMEQFLSGLSHQDPVISTLNTPPGSPVTDDRHLVGTSPTGDWVGHADEIAIYNGSGWDYEVPSEGWTLWDENTNERKNYNGSNTWVVIETLADLTAGDGLTKTGNTLDVNAGTGIQIVSDEVRTNDGQIVHDNLSGFVLEEHLRWDLTGAETIHDNRIPETAVTQHEGAIDHNNITNTHNLTTDIDHNQLQNYTDEAHRKVNFGLDSAKGTAAAYGTGFYFSSDTDVWYYSDGSTWHATTAAVESHGGGHSLGAADPIDGDTVGIDVAPVNYTPDTSPAEVSDADHLGAHLAGIGNQLAGVQTHLSASAPHSGHEETTNKGVANGYASLDTGGDVPDAQISQSSVTQHQGALDIAHTQVNDFDSGVQANRLDQMAAPTSGVDFNRQTLDLAAFQTWANDASRPGTPVGGLFGFNTTRGVPEIYIA